MNKVTINNIKKQLHKLFENTYEKNMKKIKQLQSDKNLVHKSKYFVVNIHVPDHHHMNIHDIFSSYNSPDDMLYVKKYKWRSKKGASFIRTHSLNILVIESLDENSIHIPEIRKNAWGSHNKWFNVCWLETDNSEEFNLLEHL
jgi:hypothetical protein